MMIPYKTTSVLCFLVSLHVHLGAQSFEFINVSKSARYIQTDANSVRLDTFDEYDLPYGMEISVRGEGIGSIAAPVVSGPITVKSESGFPNATYHNEGVLVYNDEDNEWGYGNPGGYSWGAASKASLDAVFGTGDYTLTVQGTTLTLSLSPEDYPNTPTLTLSGGYWENGVYYLPYDSPFTVTTNTYTGMGVHEEDAIIFSVWGKHEELINEVTIASMNPGQTTYMETVEAETFQPGGTYDVQASFFAAVDWQNSSAFPDAMILAGFEVSTRVKIVITPLPDSIPATITVGENVEVRFDTEAGYTYAIQKSSDMEHWQDDVNGIEGDGSEKSFMFASSSEGLYFRVVTE